MQKQTVEPFVQNFLFVLWSRVERQIVCRNNSRSTLFYKTMNMYFYNVRLMKPHGSLPCFYVDLRCYMTPCTSTKCPHTLLSFCPFLYSSELQKHMVLYNNVNVCRSQASVPGGFVVQTLQKLVVLYNNIEPTQPLPLFTQNYVVM